MKNQELLNIKTKQPIDQNSPAFKDFKAKLKSVNELQNKYLTLTKEFNDEMKEKMKNPDDPDGVKLKYGLISPFDTPMHILTAKMEIAKKELESAKTGEDTEKVQQYENLLQEYEHAKEVLEGTYFNGEKHSEFGLETQDAINNSKTMNEICLEENSDQRNKKLLTLIDEQYQKLPLEQKTQIEFSFTNEQLQAIIKAHMKE